jgi:hypothetical protein
MMLVSILGRLKALGWTDDEVHPYNDEFHFYDEAAKRWNALIDVPEVLTDDGICIIGGVLGHGLTWVPWSFFSLGRPTF